MEFKLNAAQQKAVEFSGKSLLILAGPGTGKTRVIISKIDHLVKSGLSPERILAVTFSKKATDEMEERLIEQLPEAAGRTEISTLHAFCIELVKRNAFRLGLGAKLRLVTEAQSQLLMRRYSSRLPLDRFAKSSYLDPLYSSLLDLFQECKDEGLWPEDIIRFASALEEGSEEEKAIKEDWMCLGDIYHAFQTACMDSGYLDFGDSILMALRLLEEHPSVRAELQKNYDALLVDEFQDTNWTQIQLLRKIAGENCQVTVVGDDDQSIYRFRGASYSAFKFFEDLFPNTEVVELTETYRLPPSVAEAATQLIKVNGNDRYKPEKELRSLHTEQKDVQLIIAPDYDEEAEWVAQKIKQQIEEGTPANEIGVLVRAHGHAETFIQRARQLAIPVQAQAQEALFDEPIVKDCFAFFKLLHDESDSISFARLLDSEFIGLEAKDIFQFCSWARSKSKNYYELLERLKEIDLSQNACDRLRYFDSAVKTLSVRANRARPSEILFEFFESSGVIKKILSNRQSHELKCLAEFQRQLVEWEQTQVDPSFRAVFPLLDSISKYEIRFESDERSNSPTEEGVKVLSIHASKGLEFQSVYMMSLVGRRFPSAFRPGTWSLPNAMRKESAPTKETHIQEERRLFYVGLTRAKKELFLTAVKKKGTKPSLFVEKDLKGFNKISLLELPAENTLEKIARKLQSPVFQRSTNEEARALLPVREKENLKLSFTQIDKYERCPRAYWFSYELGLPGPEALHLTVGSIVHESLENYYLKIKQGKRPSLEEFKEQFEKIFEAAKKDHPDLGERERELAGTGLTDYFNLYESNLPTPLAVEESFRVQLGPHVITGKIDRVDQLENGVRIVDYKTGKPKSEDKKEDLKFAKDSLQFSIYALAAKEFFKWELQELAFHYIYGGCSVLRTTRTDSDLEKTKENLHKIAARILSNDFEPTPGMQCKMCEFKNLCPDAKP